MIIHLCSVWGLPTTFCYMTIRSYGVYELGLGLSFHTFDTGEFFLMFNESEARIIYGMLTNFRGWLDSLFASAVVFTGLKSKMSDFLFEPPKRWFLRKPMDSSLYWCSQCSQCLQTQGSSSKTREKRGRCRGCGALIGNRRDEVETRPTQGTFLNLGDCKIISRGRRGAFILNRLFIFWRCLVLGRQNPTFVNILESLLVCRVTVPLQTEPLLQTGPKIFLKISFQAHCCPGCGGQLCTRSAHHWRYKMSSPY